MRNYLKKIKGLGLNLILLKKDLIDLDTHLIHKSNINNQILYEKLKIILFRTLFLNKDK